MRNSIKFLIALINFGMLCCISCRHEQDIVENKNANSVEVKFFTVPSNSTDASKAIAARIKRENDKTHFVEKFVKRVGYPRWDKTLEYKMESK